MSKLCMHVCAYLCAVLLCCLGDLWSYNSSLNEFVVSPDPEVSCHSISPDLFGVLLGSDGLWNVVRPAQAMGIVNSYEKRDRHTVSKDCEVCVFMSLRYALATRKSD